MKKRKTDRKHKKNNGEIRRNIFLRLFSDVLFLAAAVAVLPCLLCTQYTPEELFIGRGFDFSADLHVSADTGKTVAYILLFLLLADAVFLTVCAFSARFAASCEAMYTPDTGLALPKNMMTLRNGLRYASFCLLFAARRTLDAIRCFAPTSAVLVLVAVGIRYGVDKNGMITLACSATLTVLTGCIFFACSGASAERGIAVLYASRLASPVTAVGRISPQKGDIVSVLRRETRLLPFHLLSLVMPFRFYARARIRRVRGIDSLRQLYFSPKTATVSPRKHTPSHRRKET